KRLLRPLALRTPRRREHGFVQARAQRIARRARHLARGTDSARTLFEAPDLVQCMTTEIADVGCRQRSTQLSCQEQERAGGPDERIETLAQQVASRLWNRFGVACTAAGP